MISGTMGSGRPSVGNASVGNLVEGVDDFRHKGYNADISLTLHF